MLGNDAPLPADRHLLAGSSVVVDFQPLWLDADDLARCCDVLFDDLCKVGIRDDAGTVVLIVVLEVGFNVCQTLTVEVGQEDDAAVADGHPDGVGLIAVEHNVGRDISDVHRNGHLFLVNLIKGHQ